MKASIKGDKLMAQGIDNEQNASLPGPTTPEDYLIGVDTKGLEIDMAALPSGMSMGVLGGNHSGPMTDQGGVFTSTTDGLFNDGEHSDGSTQVDQMEGVQGGSPPNEVLVNEHMYATQQPLPFPV